MTETVYFGFFTCSAQIFSKLLSYPNFLYLLFDACLRALGDILSIYVIFIPFWDRRKLPCLKHAKVNGLTFTGGNSHSKGHDDEADHTVFVWRGFVALAALVIFFLAEKMINMLGEWRERKRAMHREKKVRIVRSGEQKKYAFTFRAC